MISAIITAAGAGTRFGGDVPKQFALMRNGLTVLENSIAAMTRCGEVGEVIITVPRGYVEKMKKDEKIRKDMKIIEGGASRAESIRAALGCVDPRAEIILIHDGVRPLVSCALVSAVIDAARLHGAAVPALRVTDTLKEADARGFATATVQRDRLYAVQTPQGFAREVIFRAYENARDIAAFTDDAALVEADGNAVFLVAGEKRNIKITTPEDLDLLK